MAFSHQYKTLFDVLIYHHYFLDDGATDFESMPPDEQQSQLRRYHLTDFLAIRPSVDSQKSLKNHRLIFKNTETGFTVVASADMQNPDKAAIDVNNLELTFFLTRKDMFFDNYSLIALKKEVQQHYYLSNLNGLSGGTFPSLNYPAPEFTSGQKYNMGDLVLFSGNLYEAIENISNATTNPGEGNSGWRSLTNRRYTNNNDLMNFHTGRLPFRLDTPDVEFTATIKDRFDRQTATMESSTLHDKRDFSMEISGLAEGKHRLIVTNNDDGSELLTNTFFSLKEKKPDNFLGVVNILGDVGIADYNLVNGSGELSAPGFHVRFRNRSTYWRYIDHTDGSVLLETDIQPFTRQGFINVELNSNELPNPDVRIIKPETGRIFTEVYI